MLQSELAKRVIFRGPAHEHVCLTCNGPDTQLHESDLGTDLGGGAIRLSAGSRFPPGTSSRSRCPRGPPAIKSSVAVYSSRPPAPSRRRAKQLPILRPCAVTLVTPHGNVGARFEFHRSSTLLLLQWPCMRRWSVVRDSFLSEIVRPVIRKLSSILFLFRSFVLFPTRSFYPWTERRREGRTRSLPPPSKRKQRSEPARIRPSIICLA